MEWDNLGQLFLLCPCFSKSGVENSSVGVPWELGGNAESQAPPGTCTLTRSKMIPVHVEVWTLLPFHHLPPSTLSPLHFRGHWDLYGPCSPFSKHFLCTHMKQHSEHRAFGDGSFLSLWGALTSVLSIKAKFLPSIHLFPAPTSARTPLPLPKKKPPMSPSICTSGNIDECIAFWQLVSYFLNVPFKEPHGESFCKANNCQLIHPFYKAQFLHIMISEQSKLSCWRL